MITLKDDADAPVFDHVYDAERYARYCVDNRRHAAQYRKNRWLMHTFDTAAVAYIGGLISLLMSFTNLPPSNEKFACIMSLAFIVLGVLCTLANWAVRLFWRIR